MGEKMVEKGDSSWSQIRDPGLVHLSGPSLKADDFW